MSLAIDWRENEFLREIHQDGELTGIQKAMRATLQQLLSQRFGPLPSWALDRVQSAEEGELQEALSKVLTAATLQEVLPAAKTN